MGFFTDFFLQLVDALLAAFVALVSSEIVEITDGVLSISDLSTVVM